MKKIILAAGVSLLSVASTYAAEFGVGADVNNGNATVYVPIKVSDGFRVEPYFSNQKSDQENSFNSRQTEIGLGLFNVSNLSDKTNLLLGARASYIRHHYYDESLEGYSVAPTLGFEYFPVQNISLGADVSYVYSKLDGKGSTDDITSSGTRTAVSVKFYFK